MPNATSQFFFLTLSKKNLNVVTIYLCSLQYAKSKDTFCYNFTFNNILFKLYG